MKASRQEGSEVADIDWTPAATHREGYKDEDSRMQTDEGGHKSDKNLNKRASPGSKYKQQDN